MVISKTLENFLLIQKDTNFVEILIRKTIHYWQTSHIHRPYLIDNGCQPRLQFNSVCLIYFFFFHSYLDFLFRWWFDEHRASIGRRARCQKWMASKTKFSKKKCLKKNVKTIFVRPFFVKHKNRFVQKYLSKHWFVQKNLPNHRMPKA